MVDSREWEPTSFLMGNETFSTTTEWLPLIPENGSCFVPKNRTTLFISAYEGIPDTLIVNVIAWAFLILLFAVLRQQAWDYGRLALVNLTGEKKRWTQLFYAQGSDEVRLSEPNSPALICDGVDGEQCHGSPQPSPGGTSNTNSYLDNNNRSGSPEEMVHPRGHRTATNSSQNSMTHPVDRGFLSWILITFKLTDDQIHLHSGPDALHYLSFQRHLILVMAVITFVSIVLILPINFHGQLSGDEKSFGHTTISNLEPTSPLLWIHTLCAIAFVPLVVLTMRRSSGRYAGKVAPTRTIQITNIGAQDRNRTVIWNYLKELFPESGIDDIQMAYNVKQLAEVAEEYEKVSAARSYCEIHKNRGTTVRVVPNCCTFKTMDALEYYRDKEFRLCGEVARLKASALNDPLGIAFVTFTTTEMAQHVVQHFRPATYREWTITFAPSANDLYWENLGVSTGQWYFKYATVNFLLFLFLFFLTTPVMIVNIFKETFWNRQQHISPLISEFLPTLLLWSLAAMMPAIVAYSDKWLTHWTRSKQNYSMMTKSFGYLLFMILILPSLGLTSAQTFIDWTIHYKNESYRWECIFLPDRGAFFVNYVITTAFIGTAFELIRLPELLYYLWMLCTAKSQAETPHIRKSIVDVFNFGVHYAWMLLIFTMSVVYSLASPLIMPFALVYILLKHFNDRHNLYFVYKYSNMISQGGGKIHSTAVTLTKYSVALLLLIMASLATVRSAKIDARAVVLLTSLAITLLLFMFMSPIKRCALRPPRIIETEQAAPVYTPEILLNKRRGGGMAPNSENYGGTETAQVHIKLDREDNGRPAEV